MATTTFERPINRLGFVLLCVSLLACGAAFLVTYRTNHSLSFEWLGHLLLESGYMWQQSLFKIGFFGALLGAALAWNLFHQARKVVTWVTKG
jgi:hypothetical protein